MLWKMAQTLRNIRKRFLAPRSLKTGRNNNDFHYKIKRNHNNNPLVMFNASHYMSDHPVEVVGRIRENVNQRESHVSLLVEGPNSQETSMRVKTETGYKDFSLDGISMAERENLESFYKRYIRDRVCSIRTGGKCTIIMYGPTGTGKSHTMFGNVKDPGIVYRALHCILDGEGIEDGLIKQRMKVKVSVLEIYNEDVYDLISPGASNIGWFKNGGCRFQKRECWKRGPPTRKHFIQRKFPQKQNCITKFPDEVKKVAGDEALSTSSKPVQNSSPLLSRKSIRSTGTDHSKNGFSIFKANISTFSNPFAIHKPQRYNMSKELVYGDESSGNSESTSEDQLKEMIMTDSTYGPSSPSPLTKIKSLLSSSCQDKSGIAPNDCTDNQDKIQSQHLRTCDVYVKWEVSSNEISGTLIGIIKISKDAFLKDLRKMIELDIKQDFIFLTLQDPSGAPVSKESESDLPVTILPLFPNQESWRLASLRLFTQDRMVLSDSCCSGGSSPLGLPASPAPGTDLDQFSSCSPWLSAALNSISRCKQSTISAKSSQLCDSPSRDEKMQIERTVHIRYFSQ